MDSGSSFDGANVVGELDVASGIDVLDGAGVVDGAVVGCLFVGFG